MPKEIVTAAEALGASAEDTPEIPSSVPSTKPAEPVSPEPPAAGFEAPPASEQDAAPQTAADVLATPPPSAAPLQAKEAVIPAKPETIAPTEPEYAEPAAPVVPKVKIEWRFVKNIHFGEKLIFLDGTEYVFKSALHIVRDSELAQKILAVAKKYNIVEQ
jgi:hypothetical protein